MNAELATGLGMGVVNGILRNESQVLLTQDNIERLVHSLSKMRGAALKLVNAIFDILTGSNGIDPG